MAFFSGGWSSGAHCSALNALYALYSLHAPETLCTSHHWYKLCALYAKYTRHSLFAVNTRYPNCDARRRSLSPICFGKNKVAGGCVCVRARVWEGFTIYPASFQRSSHYRCPALPRRAARDHAARTHTWLEHLLICLVPIMQLRLRSNAIAPCFVCSHMCVRIRGHANMGGCTCFGCGHW